MEEDKRGVKPFTLNKEKSIPEYLVKEREFFEHRKLIGYMRCYDCSGDVPLDQADSFLCRKVHQTISRLSLRGWSHKDILRECKMIYGNDIIYRHYEAPPPVLSFKFMLLFWGAYMLRAKYFRVRWEKLVKYKQDRYY